jgi:hypothetical protein
MSSNRANASARQRRAGEPVGLQQQQQQQQRMQPGRGMGGRPGMSEPQQQQQQQQVPMNPKLSVSDAIALITLRLGRVETIVSNLPNEPRGDGEGGGQMMYDENMRMVDQNVFNSIVSRIDTLEKNQKLLIEKQKAAPVVQNTAAPPIKQMVQETIIKDVSDEKIEPMRETIQVLKDEVSELKDLLIKLQSFTMETNKKLTDIVFDDNIPQMFNQSFMFHGGASMMGGQPFKEDVGDEMIVLENIDDESCGGEEIACENLKSSNLKDLIRQELMNEEVAEGLDNM